MTHQIERTAEECRAIAGVCRRVADRLMRQGHKAENRRDTVRACLLAARSRLYRHHATTFDRMAEEREASNA